MQLEMSESTPGLQRMPLSRIRWTAILAGREESASPDGRQAAHDTLRTASIASGWLTAATLLSLLAAIVGGWQGARATTHRIVHAHPPTTLSADAAPGTSRP